MPPIKPNNIAVANTEAIPEAVFDVFNALIAEHWDGRRAVIELADVCERLKGQEYKQQHLNVESAYRHAGWKVKYDQPASPTDIIPVVADNWKMRLREWLEQRDALLQQDRKGKR